MVMVSPGMSGQQQNALRKFLLDNAPIYACIRDGGRLISDRVDIGDDPRLVTLTEDPTTNALLTFEGADETFHMGQYLTNIKPHRFSVGDTIACRIPEPYTGPTILDEIREKLSEAGAANALSEAAVECVQANGESATCVTDSNGYVGPWEKAPAATATRVPASYERTIAILRDLLQQETKAEGRRVREGESESENYLRELEAADKHLDEFDLEFMGCG